ncbi:MAG TPA: hypothetical protein VH370_24810 [Humisphaera sp.]|jgi:hypothetical protein|nr:hypothetical protein [Humisphaera sp.]
METTDKHETVAVVDFAAAARVGDLPFATGDRVRVVITRENGKGPRHTPDEIARSRAIRGDLRGSPIRYDRPFDPVGVEDWKVLKDEPGAD